MQEVTVYKNIFLKITHRSIGPRIGPDDSLKASFLVLNCFHVFARDEI